MMMKETFISQIYIYNKYTVILTRKRLARDIHVKGMAPTVGNCYLTRL